MLDYQALPACQEDSCRRLGCWVAVGRVPVVVPGEDASSDAGAAAAENCCDGAVL